MGSDLAPVHGPERAVNGGPRRLADIAGGPRRDLGFAAEVDLDEGLRGSSTGGGRAGAVAPAGPRDRDRAPEASAADGDGPISVMRPWLGSRGDRGRRRGASPPAGSPRVRGSREFEAALSATAQGAPHGVAVSSCTTGLHLALVVAGVGPGDDVVVPSLSFIATANAVRYVGARPVFADVDADHRQPHRRHRRGACSPRRTRAVIVVDQGGVPADLRADPGAVRPAGHRRGRGRACGAGSTYRGTPGRARAPTWPLLLPPPQDAHHRRGRACSPPPTPTGRPGLRRLREHGMNISAAERHASGAARSRSPTSRSGFNYRMTDLQAAVGLVQLGRLDEMVAERRRSARRGYRDACWPVSRACSWWPTRRTGPPTTSRSGSMLPDDFPVDRDELLAWLAADGISARRGIMAAHLEPAYAGHPARRAAGHRAADRESLILPLFHGMTEADQDRVVAVLADVPGGRTA